MSLPSQAMVALIDKIYNTEVWKSHTDCDNLNINVLKSPANKDQKPPVVATN